MSEPLPPTEAKKAVRAILESAGTIIYTGHARRRMAKRRVSEVDVVNVLRGGWCEPAEWENGGWRHRVCTQRIHVGVEIEVDENELTVVTVIRVERLR